MTDLRQPVTRSMRVNDIALTYYEWRAKPGDTQPPLLIAHATGFHGRCYGAIADLFPDRRVIALDLRGHGRSEGGPIDHWLTVASDVQAFIKQLRIRSAVGIGHSMGAHVLLQCASENSDAFSRLVLFDPVIVDPSFYEETPDDPAGGAPHPAIRRKRDFASPEAMMERFSQREPYSLFTQRVFEDYCRFGLTPVEGKGFVLSCTPEMEASVYSSSRTNVGIFDAAKAVSQPVLVVRAQKTSLNDFKGSPTWTELASIIPNGRDLYRPDRTHFHPFEDPDDAAKVIREFEQA